MQISAAAAAGCLHDESNQTVMPGFRFHPTEEELVDFYLRRKVEGKRFQVDLINLLDLYSYDPWELPAMAAIGEKEWYFYVPRDRKYRNGDRPNRVTSSGYWKATGADRVVRSQDMRFIGLKKTLVFYTGKAPKGVRTAWVMNEYRLPSPHHTPELSLCKVYKRMGSPTSSSSSTPDPQLHWFHQPANESTRPMVPPPSLNTPPPLLNTPIHNSRAAVSEEQEVYGNHSHGCYINDGVDGPLGTFALSLPSPPRYSHVSLLDQVWMWSTGGGGGEDVQ